MKQWKFDWQHIAIAIAFVVGVVWSFGAIIGMVPKGQPLSATMLAIAPVLVLAISHVLAFFKNPPSNPADALQQGENVVSLTGKRGFIRLGTLVGFLVVGVVVGALTVRAQRHVSATLPVAVQAEGEGCGFLQHESPTLKQDAQVDGGCILSAVLEGMTDPVLIGAKCGVPAGFQLGQFVADAIAWYTSPHADGGVGAAPPPYAGMPATISDADLAKLRALQAKLAGASR